MTAQSPQLESVIKHWSGPGPTGVAGTPSASQCILELREPPLQPRQRQILKSINPI